MPSKHLRYRQPTQKVIHDLASAVRALASTATRPNSATVTSVGDSATSVTLLSATLTRRGATVYNLSTAILYLKCGTTASAADFTVALAGSGGYWEAPFGYTGRIDGIWASDAGGTALVTEFS